ncbi:MAG: cobalt-precorrin-5B (C(1))-methyltransferase [Candidatus Puniceispirillales bacterium]
MQQTLKTTLRFGWTTGTCATASVYAAYTAMVTGTFPETVTIDTPSGKAATLDISYTAADGNSFSAGVIKDAGDDPDVTHGAEIRATVTRAASGSGVIFHAGEGVGVVTRPGLPIAVGEPAINPVPRKMISDIINSLAEDIGGSPDIEVTISVPNGREIAQKTWNPRLGIINGISILGTTGVVRPFSCSAWIASIHRGIDVAGANALDHIAGSTGATSEKAVQQKYHLPVIALIDMGDFVGGMLKYLRRHPVKRLTIAGGFGKMITLAQGATDLHSARSQIDFDNLAKIAYQQGIASDGIANANSALEVATMLDAGDRARLATVIANSAMATCRDMIGGAPTMLGLMIVDREGNILSEVSES